jgi:hypothetical protein
MKKGGLATAPSEMIVSWISLEIHAATQARLGLEHC